MSECIYCSSRLWTCLITLAALIHHIDTFTSAHHRLKCRLKMLGRMLNDLVVHGEAHLNHNVIISVLHSLLNLLDKRRFELTRLFGKRSRQQPSTAQHVRHVGSITNAIFGNNTSESFLSITARLENVSWFIRSRSLLCWRHKRWDGTDCGKLPSSVKKMKHQQESNVLAGQEMFIKKRAFRSARLRLVRAWFFRAIYRLVVSKLSGSNR